MTNQNPTTTTRRTTLAAAAALAFGSATGAKAAANASPIKSLWGEARAIDRAMGAHAQAIATAADARGIPGWMVLDGPANALGEARYGKLVSILNAAPADSQDLAIMAHASQDRDIVNGPRAWAGERLAQAAIGLNALAA
jgi:hypothetical protein